MVIKRKTEIEKSRMNIKNAIYMAGYRSVSQYCEMLGISVHTLRLWSETKPKMIEYFISILKDTDREERIRQLHACDKN